MQLCLVLSKWRLWNDLMNEAFGVLIMKRTIVIIFILGGCLSACALDTRFWTNYHGAYKAYEKNKTKQAAEELLGAYQLLKDASTYPVPPSLFPPKKGKPQQVAASWQKLARKQMEELKNIENDELKTTASAMLLAKTYILNKFCPLTPKYKWLLRKMKNKLASVKDWDKAQANDYFDELFHELGKLVGR